MAGLELFKRYGLFLPFVFVHGDKRCFLATAFPSKPLLFGRIAEIAESEGHHPDLHLVGYNQVSAQLTTHSAGGLTENDFIMAVR